jgi:hypothetical protein
MQPHHVMPEPLPTRKLNIYLPKPHPRIVINDPLTECPPCPLPLAARSSHKEDANASNAPTPIASCRSNRSICLTATSCYNYLHRFFQGRACRAQGLSAWKRFRTQARTITKERVGRSGRAVSTQVTRASRRGAAAFAVPSGQKPHGTPTAAPGCHGTGARDPCRTSQMPRRERVADAGPECRTWYGRRRPGLRSGPKSRGKPL